MTTEEIAEVQRVHDVMQKAMGQEIWQMAQCVATKRDDQVFGQTEFTLREKVLRMGAQALDAICYLRALHLSEPACWESFWDPS